MSHHRAWYRSYRIDPPARPFFLTPLCADVQSQEGQPFEGGGHPGGGGAGGGLLEPSLPLLE